MKKNTIIGIIMFLLLIGGMVFVYFKFYNPNSNQEFVNVSISAEYQRKRIITEISINNEIFLNTSDSYELVQVSKGITTIKNLNLKGQEFYENTQTLNLTENTRINIDLEKPEEINLDKDYKENKVILEIFSKNFQELKFCLKGSLNYLFLEAENFTEIPKLEGFENYEICYDSGFSLKDTKEKINITYLVMGKVNPNDYINISFIDKAGNSEIENIK